MVRSLIAANADVNCFCEVSCCVIGYLIYIAHTYIATSLLYCSDILARLGDDVYCTVIYTQHQLTPLHAAALEGHYDVVRTLGEANADKSLLNEVYNM